MANLRSLWFGLLFSCTAAVYADEPTATPYRPTVSNPAALSEPGWLEIEAGVTRISGGDDKQRDSLPYLLKYAFNPDWGGATRRRSFRAPGRSR